VAVHAYSGGTRRDHRDTLKVKQQAAEEKKLAEARREREKELQALHDEIQLRNERAKLRKVRTHEVVSINIVCEQYIENCHFFLHAELYYPDIRIFSPIIFFLTFFNTVNGNLVANFKYF
jgi:hypothetical protein